MGYTRFIRGLEVMRLWDPCFDECFIFTFTFIIFTVIIIMISVCRISQKRSGVVELRAQSQNLKSLPSLTVVFIVFTLYLVHVQRWYFLLSHKHVW